MTLQIVPLSPHHLPAAASLLALQVQSLQAQVRCLPARYTDPTSLLPIIQEIAISNPGVAAIDDGQLVGFLTAWRLPAFEGAPAAFSPELANAARLADRQHIYEAMYASLAETWVAEGFHNHLISLFPNDTPGLEAWSWLGFGMLAADAVRDLSPIPAPPPACQIRRALPEDAAVIAQLDNALDTYLCGSPVYIRHEPDHSASEVLGWLENPQNAFWLALDGDRSLAFIGFGPASQDACQVIVDDQTTSISAAYTLPAARSQGIAAALLNHGLAWARTQGYTRCAVDFEPMNPLARRFWLRYFHPVSYTLGRRVI